MNIDSTNAARYSEKNARKMLDEASQMVGQAKVLKERAQSKENNAHRLEQDANLTLQHVKAQELKSVSVQITRNVLKSENAETEVKNIKNYEQSKSILNYIDKMILMDSFTAAKAQSNQTPETVQYLLRESN